MLSVSLAVLMLATSACVNVIIKNKFECFKVQPSDVEGLSVDFNQINGIWYEYVRNTVPAYKDQSETFVLKIDGTLNRAKAAGTVEGECQVYFDTEIKEGTGEIKKAGNTPYYIVEDWMFVFLEVEIDYLVVLHCIMGKNGCETKSQIISVYVRDKDYQNAKLALKEVKYVCCGDKSDYVQLENIDECEDMV